MHYMETSISTQKAELQDDIFPSLFLCLDVGKEAKSCALNGLGVETGSNDQSHFSALVIWASWL